MINPIVFIVCSLPLVGIAIEAFMRANPWEVIIQSTGLWSLRFLILTLTITPLRLLTGWSDLNKRFKLRRVFGLYAFFYSSLHVLSYLWFEQFFDWEAIIHDVMQHMSLTTGLIAFLLMIPLALTSNSPMIKQLGKQRWKHLHQLMYPITIVGIIHFWLLAQTKADIQEPLIYAIIVAVLLFIRFLGDWKRF